MNAAPVNPSQVNIAQIMAAQVNAGQANGAQVNAAAAPVTMGPVNLQFGSPYIGPQILNFLAMFQGQPSEDVYNAMIYQLGTGSRTAMFPLEFFFSRLPTAQDRQLIMSSFM
jgi:hypothetical protein